MHLIALFYGLGISFGVIFLIVPIIVSYWMILKCKKRSVQPDFLKKCLLLYLPPFGSQREVNENLR